MKPSSGVITIGHRKKSASERIKRHLLNYAFDSDEKIAQRFGVSRLLVWQIRCDLLLGNRKVGRCPTCGALVALPCLACRLRAGTVEEQIIESDDEAAPAFTSESEMDERIRTECARLRRKRDVEKAREQKPNSPPNGCIRRYTSDRHRRGHSTP